MECKFCHAAIEDDSLVCPLCGKDLTEETETEEVLSASLTNEVELGAGDEEIEEAEETEEAEEEETEEKPKTSGGLLWGIIIGILVALVAVAGFFFWQNRSTAESEILFTGMQSYTVAEKDMTNQRAHTVVAKLGTENKLGGLKNAHKLTNAQLALYYWDTFYSYYESYYYYASYLGLDPLTMDTTECMLSPGQSWQEYFLTHALTRYKDQMAVCRKAEAEGFKLSEEAQKIYDDNVKAIQESADIQVAIYKTYGAGITVEDYLEYWKMQYYYSCYVTHLMDSVEYTDADLSDFYDLHSADYAGMRVLKIDKPVVNVRHILIEPADASVEADWAAAEKTAQDVLAAYLAGDRTESSFGELAKEHSADGTKELGGLYENVYPGQTVQAFEDWCFDAARKPADTGIVKTEYGYHIMYFISQGELIYWKEVVRADYVSEAANSVLVEMATGYKLKYEAAKITLPLPGQLTNPQQ